MAYRRITAIEAAEMINDGDMMALSGFTPNGNPKAIFRELSKRAIRLHDAGQPFQVGILTGASSCQSVEDHSVRIALLCRNCHVTQE